MKQRDIAAPAFSDRRTDRGGLYGEAWTAKLRRVRDHPTADAANAGHDVNVVAEPPAAAEGGAVSDATPFLRSLGRALRERRDAIGLTQEAVSLRTGVPQRRIWELEAGIGNPTARTLLRLVSGLDMPCSELFARAEALAATPSVSGDGRAVPDDA
jgi:DNA-binding XRE family transcriptional regulator